jgi:hypothetical protein
LVANHSSVSRSTAADREPKLPSQHSWLHLRTDNTLNPTGTWRRTWLKLNKTTNRCLWKITLMMMVATHHRASLRTLGGSRGAQGRTLPMLARWT